MKVYLVDNGEEYSDWSVNAVFTDEQFANQYAEYGGGNVFEFDTDSIKSLASDEFEYVVTIDYRDNSVVSVTQNKVAFSETKFMFWNKYQLFAVVIARTEDEAIDMALSRIPDKAREYIEFYGKWGSKYTVYIELKEVFG